MAYLIKRFPLSAVIFLLCISNYSSAQTWTTLNANSLSWRFEDLFFVDADIGWAVDGGGQILKTLDGGDNWVQQFYDSDQFFRSVEFFDANIGFAGTLSNALFKTTNGGTTWVNITSTLPVVPTGICGMSVANDSTIFLTGTFFGDAYFMRSTDHGTTWTHTVMANMALGLVDVHFKNSLEGFLIGQGPQGTGLKARILHTIDGGQNWVLAHEGVSINERAWKIQFLNDTIAYVSVEDLSPNPHYYKTIDGGITWQNHDVMSTLTAGTVQGIGFLNEDVGWVGGFNDLFFETTDGGQTWAHQPSIGLSFNRFWRMNEHTMYVGGLNIYKYTNTNLGVHDAVDPIVPIGHTFRLQGGNPTSGNSIIELDLVNDTHVELSVYTLSGKRVQTIDARMRNKGAHTVEWEHDLGPGFYLLALYTNYGYGSIKVLVE